MAGKSPTELFEMIAELRTEVEVLKTRAAGFDERVGPADLAAVRERLAVVERLLADLIRRVDENERLAARLAVVESQLAGTKRPSEEADQRRWQVVAAGLASVFALLANVVLLFAKR